MYRINISSYILFLSLFIVMIMMVLRIYPFSCNKNILSVPVGLPSHPADFSMLFDRVFTVKCCAFNLAVAILIDFCSPQLSLCRIGDFILSHERLLKTSKPFHAVIPFARHYRDINCYVSGCCQWLFEGGQ